MSSNPNLEPFNGVPPASQMHLVLRPQSRENQATETGPIENQATSADVKSTPHTSFTCENLPVGITLNNSFVASISLSVLENSLADVEGSYSDLEIITEDAMFEPYSQPPTGHPTLHPLYPVTEAFPLSQALVLNEPHWHSLSYFPQHVLGINTESLHQAQVGTGIQPAALIGLKNHSTVLPKTLNQERKNPGSKRRNPSSYTSAVCKEAHGSEARQVWACDLCQKMFKNKTHFQLHRDRHDPRYSRMYTCGSEGCGFGTSTKRALRAHVKKTGHESGQLI